MGLSSICCTKKTLLVEVCLCPRKPPEHRTLRKAINGAGSDISWPGELGGVDQCHNFSLSNSITSVFNELYCVFTSVFNDGASSFECSCFKVPLCSMPTIKMWEHCREAGRKPVDQRSIFIPAIYLHSTPIVLVRSVSGASPHVKEAVGGKGRGLLQLEATAAKTERACLFMHK